MVKHLLKLLGSIELRHVVVVVVSLAGAVLATRQDAALSALHRAGNIASGFLFASLGGFILMERGWESAAAAGTSYLLGHVGNRLCNSLVNAAKKAEGNLLAFVKELINLRQSAGQPPPTDGTQP